MKIKKENMKRLASLSALGAGALGMSAGSAEASSIVYSGLIDTNVGFSRGFLTSATFAGPNGVGGRLKLFSASALYEVRLTALPGIHGTHFGFLSTHRLAWAVPSGAKWGAARCGHHACRSDSQAPVAGFSINSFSTNRFTDFNATDRYLLFRFSGGTLSQDLYGWAQLTVSLKHRSPDVTLVDWAYDASGAQIPAGDKGQTPEPSTFVLTGLAALALGAKGLRSWRAARKAS